jgi:hypothetical protein
MNRQFALTNRGQRALSAEGLSADAIVPMSSREVPFFSSPMEVSWLTTSATSEMFSSIFGGLTKEISARQSDRKLQRSKKETSSRCAVSDAPSPKGIRFVAVSETFWKSRTSALILSYRPLLASGLTIVVFGHPHQAGRRSAGLLCGVLARLARERLGALWQDSVIFDSSAGVFSDQRRHVGQLAPTGRVLFAIVFIPARGRPMAIRTGSTRLVPIAVDRCGHGNPVSGGVRKDASCFQMQTSRPWMGGFPASQGCTPDMHPNVNGCKQPCQVRVNGPVYAGILVR